MRIREYNPGTDLAALKRMHAAQGFDYVFPNLDHPEFFTRLVVEDEDGVVVMAGMGRLTAEMYLFMDPAAGTPMQRFERFCRLHRASEQDVICHGVQDWYAQIPPGPKMEKFKRLLALLGWVRANTWESWTKPQLSINPGLGLLQKLFQRRVGNGTQRAEDRPRSVAGHVQVSDGHHEGATGGPEGRSGGADATGDQPG
jgi:hypothetical protein